MTETEDILNTFTPGLSEIRMEVTNLVKLQTILRTHTASYNLEGITIVLSWLEASKLIMQQIITIRLRYSTWQLTHGNTTAVTIILMVHCKFWIFRDNYSKSHFQALLFTRQFQPRTQFSLLVAVRSRTRKTQQTNITILLLNLTPRNNGVSLGDWINSA